MSDFPANLSHFSKSHYAQTLRAFAARGYACVGLEGIDAARPTLFLRHDVDLDLDRARAIAEIETTLGMFATYYVLVSTNFYNLSAAGARRQLGDLRRMGHRIGLHFDATLYDPDELEAGAREECAILEAVSSGPVDSISFHRPAKALLNREGRFAGHWHCYEPRFFSEIAYVSDSNGGWHHGHPLEHEAVRAGRAIQLLTHPIWWAEDEPSGAIDILEAFRERREARLMNDLTGTVTAYKDFRSDRAG